MPRLTDDESDVDMKGKDVEMDDDEDDEPEDPKSDAAKGADNDDGAEEDDEEENLDEDEFEIEKILGHRFTGKVLEFRVKWKGYDDEADQTWEPEDNCSGAPNVVQGYFTKLGGRPAPPSKRGRQPATPGTGPAPKKSIKKEEGATAATTTTTTATTPGDDKWKPPTGSWEDEVRAIDTLEKTDAELVCYIQWVNGRRTQHPVHVVYKKCPQQMLKFYESHLVFRDQQAPSEE